MELEIEAMQLQGASKNIFKRLNLCDKFKQKGFILNNQPTWQTVNKLWWWFMKKIRLGM